MLYITKTPKYASRSNFTVISMKTQTSDDMKYIWVGRWRMMFIYRAVEVEDVFD